LNSEEFLNWANKNTQTLWCPGIAGAGKTILTSVVIKHLKDAQKDKEPAARAGIACLYCEYERQKDQTPHSLLAAVLRQLADQSIPFPKSVEELYRLHYTAKTHHSFDEISSVLTNAIRKFSQVFLVVDALDECSEKNCRELLSNLQDLQKKTGIKLLATSRHTVDFRRNFEECAMLEIKANESDVRAVLDSQMGVLSACVTTDNSALRNKVKEEIAAAVDGMYAIDSRTHSCFITD
jgi:Cdc6-like AAA superfamily ATPase